MTGSKYKYLEYIQIFMVLFWAGLAGAAGKGDDAQKSETYLDKLEAFAEEHSTGSANKGVVWGGLCDFRFQHLTQTDVEDKMKWDQEPFTLSEFRINCKIDPKKGYPYTDVSQQETPKEISSKDKKASSGDGLHYLRVCAHKRKTAFRSNAREKICEHHLVEEDVSGARAKVRLLIAEAANARPRSSYYSQDRLFSRTKEILDKAGQDWNRIFLEGIANDVYKKVLIQANLKWGNKKKRSKNN